jgi:hypothetical protein
VPLLVAAGPGAVSRFDIGPVIPSGLGFGTLFVNTSGPDQGFSRHQE